jgi:hypothetical protein
MVIMVMATPMMAKPISIIMFMLLVITADRKLRPEEAAAAAVMLISTRGAKRS